MVKTYSYFFKKDIDLSNMTMGECWEVFFENYNGYNISSLSNIYNEMKNTNRYKTDEKYHQMIDKTYQKFIKKHRLYSIKDLSKELSLSIEKIIEILIILKIVQSDNGIISLKPVAKDCHYIKYVNKRRFLFTVKTLKAIKNHIENNA